MRFQLFKRHFTRSTAPLRGSAGAEGNPVGYKHYYYFLKYSPKCVYAFLPPFHNNPVFNAGYSGPVLGIRVTHVPSECAGGGGLETQRRE